VFRATGDDELTTKNKNKINERKIKKLETRRSLFG
jgi:hypothetical protein